jgi:hypothetical protein
MKKELIQKFLVRTLSNGIQCYNVDRYIAPNTYEEILRISQAGFDITDAKDEYDDIYSYLVAFDPTNNEIISFYRYILCNKAINNGHVGLSTGQYYEYVPMFLATVMQNAIELGRSVINKEAEMEIANPGTGLNAIWRGGLGPLVYKYCLKFQDTKEAPVRYLFGQASLQAKYYDVFDKCGFESLMRIFALFIKNFSLQNPESEVVFPKKPLEFFQKPFDFKLYLDSLTGNYKEDSKSLKSFLKENSMHVPNLFFHYGNLDSNNEGNLHMFWPVYNSLLDCYEMALCWDITSISDAHRKMFIGDPSDINLRAFE